jgi:predicted ATPase/DNA-binding CsgD family transcriptional regulator
MSSSGASPTNLPSPLTRFIGRETEVAEAAALLAINRLLTLTGPGGAGKTRLALRLAASVAEQFPDGVWFVDFSPLSGGEFVWDRVASTIGIREPRAGTPWAQAAGSSLAPRQGLLVLDNCEHVVESAAEVTAELLAAAPALKVVATSREPLGVAGEVTWAVPPLNEADAVELFIDRARQARPQFRVRDEDSDAVRTICRRLDGLPLAIELAAARARGLDLPYIAAGLKDRLGLLPSGPRTAPQRQSTLAASFDWSHELLTDGERALLRQLSVFAGGFDVEAALAVCPAASLELLAALTDRSLIMIEQRSDRAGPRYRMLATVREFAAEHLNEAEEVDLIQTHHRDHYLAVAESGLYLLGAEKSHWLDHLRGEEDNLREAMARSRDRGEIDALVRMLIPLTQAWGGRARWIEAHMWLDVAADRAGDVSLRSRAWIRVLQCFVPILAGKGSFSEFPAHANEALELARASGDKDAETLALAMLGFVAALVGGAEAMRPYVNETLPQFRSAAYIPLGPAVLGAFAALRWFQSDPEEPRRLAEEAIVMVRASGDRHFLISAVWIAGMTALIQGRLVDAAQRFDSAVADSRQDNDTMLWMALLGRAWVATFRGDFGEARAAVSESQAATRGTDAAEMSVRMVGPTARLVLGWMELAAGHAARAREAIAPLVDAIRSTPMSRYAAVPLVVLAEAQLALGAHDDAEASLDEATALARAGALTWVLGRAGVVRAKLRAREGDLHEAESLAHEAVRLGSESSDQLGLVDALELLARLANEQESAKEAVRLWAAAESLRGELGYTRFPVEQGPYEAEVAGAKQALGPNDFAAAWADGATLSPDEAIAYSRRGRGQRKRPSTGWTSLTPSELEVVRLVGQHLSNPEIAARLFVSRATVKTHLVHIFAKLGVDSRSELAGEAVKRGPALQPSRSVKTQPKQV